MARFASSWLPLSQKLEPPKIPCGSIFDEFRITIAKQTLSRELRAMGYRKLSARPRHHAQAEGAVEDFKKASPCACIQSREKAIDSDKIEVWFSDEARIGQKNKITRRWAKRGTRPSAPHDQRTASTYIFGAVCPKQGKGAALILPACNTEAMNLHLAEIALMVTPASGSPRTVLPSSFCAPPDLGLSARKTLTKNRSSFVGSEHRTASRASGELAPGQANTPFSLQCWSDISEIFVAPAEAVPFARLGTCTCFGTPAWLGASTL